jgi:hypothetical protein
VPGDHIFDRPDKPEGSRTINACAWFRTAGRHPPGAIERGTMARRCRCRLRCRPCLTERCLPSRSFAGHTVYFIFIFHFFIPVGPTFVSPRLLLLLIKASAALHLSGHSVSVATALPSELDSAHALRRVLLPPVSQRIASFPSKISSPALAPPVVSHGPPCAHLSCRIRAVPLHTGVVLTIIRFFFPQIPRAVKKDALTATQLLTFSASSPLISTSAMSVAPRMDIDARRAPFNSGVPNRAIGASIGYGMPAYTISTNPPNPKSNFRAGDWM